MSSIKSLDQLVKQPINSKTTLLVIEMLRKAIRCTTNPIENSLSRRRTSPLCEVLKSNNTPYVPPLSIFVKELIRRSNVSTGTVIVSLLYIERLQKNLPEATQGIHCACHRVFLAALILSAKTLNDSSPKNRHWARYASCFPLAEVNLMERQLFLLLDYDLSVSEKDLLRVCSPLIDLCIPVTKSVMGKKEPYEKAVKIMDGYMGETLDASLDTSDDSAYSSDSELTCSNTLLADLELAHIAAKSISSSSEPSIEQWDFIW